MTEDQVSAIQIYVNEHIDLFHSRRIESIKQLRLKEVLEKKNPYMFRTKDIRTPQELIEPILQARLSSSEESQFGNILEGLAIFCAELFYGGHKVPGSGLDLMLKRDNVTYIVAIKSGNNWGNSSQHAKLKDNFKAHMRVLRQNKDIGSIRPVLGICYGKVQQTNDDDYLKLCGQSFWEFISGDSNLYIDIVEPLGYEAERHNENFRSEYAATLTRFVFEFTRDYCDPSGRIDWVKLVKFNSGRR